VVRLLLFGKLKVAGQFHGDELRLAVAGDQQIHQPAQLIEADMDGGIGDAAHAQVIDVLGVAAARRNVAFENLLIGRQARLAVLAFKSKPGVVIAAAFGGLRLRDYCCL